MGNFLTRFILTVFCTTHILSANITQLNIDPTIEFELVDEGVVDQELADDSFYIPEPGQSYEDYMHEMECRVLGKKEMLSEQEEIETEIFEGELELLAQLVRAEAGNQSMEGKRAVVDVVLNRVESEAFPGSTIEEVIFYPSQFSCINDGGFDRAAWTVDESDYEAVRLELENRTDETIVFFNYGTRCTNGNYAYTIGDHVFGTL